MYHIKILNANKYKWLTYHTKSDDFCNCSLQYTYPHYPQVFNINIEYIVHDLSIVRATHIEILIFWLEYIMYYYHIYTESEALSPTSLSNILPIVYKIYNHPILVFGLKKKKKKGGTWQSDVCDLIYSNSRGDSWKVSFIILYTLDEVRDIIKTVSEKTASACKRIATRIVNVHTPQSSSFLRCIIIIIIISYTRRNPLFRTHDKALPPLTLLSRTHSGILRHIPPDIFSSINPGYHHRRRHQSSSTSFIMYFIIYSVVILSQIRNKYFWKGCM